MSLKTTPAYHCIISVVTILIVLASSELRAADLHVTPGGDDGNDCLSVGTACATITVALTKAGAGDTINVAAGTYAEVNITVNETLTIRGAGADDTIVNSDLDDDGIGEGRVFDIDDAQNGITATVTDLTIRDGQTAAGGGGVLVNMGGTLNLDNVTFIDNSSSGMSGGALLNNAGTVNITGCLFTENNVRGNGGAIGNSGTMSITQSLFTMNRTSLVGDGGAIFNEGILTISESTFQQNEPRVNGGAIATDDGTTLSIDKTTLADNTANARGGAVFNNNAMVTITNSTLSGNQAFDDGGGIFLTPFGGSASVDLNNATITENTADVDGNGTGIGGGIAGTGGTVNMSHSILANNVDNNPISPAPNCGIGITSDGHNLLGDNTSCAFSGSDGVNGDQVGTGVSPIDPLLDPLADNGGPTQTHALSAGSPALDTPEVTATPCETDDQRGFLRANAAPCDIGAFEVGCGDGLVQTFNAEECDDGNTSAGDGCDADCQNEVQPTCGDGILQAGEECDDGNTNSGDGCSASCVEENGGGDSGGTGNGGCSLIANLPGAL